ncbi:RNA-binding post-transcriptional regulator cip2, partial [Aureobasidium melanogenum]
SYAHLPSGLYGAEDQQQQRFDAPRYNDRMGAPPNMHQNMSQNMNQNMNQNYGGYDMGAQNWNSAAFGSNTIGALGASQRRRAPQQAPRNGLPSAWLDQPQPMPQVSPYLGLGGGVLGAPSIRSDQLGSEPDEELIPTAIVIKNIPFAVKKEQLVQLMTDMGLPLPYAFNYHFDNGVFRGLAFANFTSPDETAAVIDAMNHFELQGRKLRVEYKKMLPAAERERIEREKRERRGQLEEQHRPMATQTLQTQTSMSSLTGHMPPASPSPVSAGNVGLAVDLNNPDTL